jgi:hypothetical protein
MIKPEAIKCPHCRQFLDGRPTGPGGRAFARDLKTEAHFLALGFWFRILAVLTVLAGIFIGIGVLASHNFGRLDGALGMVVVAIMIVFGVFGFFIGQGLSRYQNWARLTTAILSVISVAVGALGAVANVAQMGKRGAEAGGNCFGQLLSIALYVSIAVVMFGSRACEICTDQYRQGMSQTPDQKPSMISSPFFWIYAIFLGIMLLAVLIIASVGFSHLR